MGPPLLPDDFQSYWRTHAGNFTTLPQAFRTHGYDCHSFGKVFHPSKPSGKGAPKNYSWVWGEPATNADDYPFSWSSPPFHPPTQKDKNAPTCAASVPQQANTSALYSNMYCPVDPSAEPGGNLPDIQTTDAALALLEGYSKAPQPRNPLFLAVGFHKVRRNATRLSALLASRSPRPRAQLCTFALSVLSNGVLSQPHIPLKFPREFLRFIPPEDKLSLAPDGAVSPWLGAAPGSVAFQPWADGKPQALGSG